MIFLLKMLSRQYRVRRQRVLSARRYARVARIYRDFYKREEECRQRVRAGFLSSTLSASYPDTPQIMRLVQYQPTKGVQ